MPVSEPMERLLCREMDLCEYFLQSEIISVMGYGSCQAANWLMHLKNGTMMNLESSVTLPNGMERESRHTVFTTNGMISDTAADKVVRQEKIYVYSQDAGESCYSDFDVNLYGLSLDEENVCYACFALMTGREDLDAWEKQAMRIRALAKAALETLDSGKKYTVQ